MADLLDTIAFLHNQETFGVVFVSTPLAPSMSPALTKPHTGHERWSRLIEAVCSWHRSDPQCCRVLVTPTLSSEVQTSHGQTQLNVIMETDRRPSGGFSLHSRTTLITPVQSGTVSSSYSLDPQSLIQIRKNSIREENWEKQKSNRGWILLLVHQDRSMKITNRVGNKAKLVQSPTPVRTCLTYCSEYRHKNQIDKSVMPILAADISRCICITVCVH